MAQSSHSRNLQNWANRLNGDAQWVSSLNSAFDAIGFTEQYIAEAKRSRRSKGRKALKDSVWGMVDLDAVATWLVDSPLIQRLRYVKQLGLSYLTYPGAQHSRFEHSVGVYHVVTRLLEAFKRNDAHSSVRDDADAAIRPYCYGDETYQSVVVRLSALLHDIGHVPFSHAGEGFFDGYKDVTRIGPYKVSKFIRDFRFAYWGITEGDRLLESREKKSLSELFSAAIVLSARFRTFLGESCPHEFGRSPDQVCADIAALILGDPIEESDLALPQLVSGPVDADKIDYMLRDAHACGLELGIDVSRLFFRASVYEIRRSDALSEDVPERIREAPKPVLLFLVDQSGTESALEMGLARLSLYSRVYYHQLTLNAEAALIELLNAAAATGGQTGEWGDLLRIWTYNDQSLLFSLSKAEDGAVRQLASDILNRRLLKRAGSFSVDMFAATGTGSDFPSTELDGAAERLHVEAHEQFNKLVGDRSRREALAIQIRDLCGQFVANLRASGEPAENLPDDASPAFVRFILPKDRKKTLLPQALLITPTGEVAPQRARDASYVDAGKLAIQRGYLLVPKQWRQFALLALQLAIYRNDELKIQRGAVEGGFRILFRPVLRLDAAANESRLNWHTVRELQEKLRSFFTETQLLVEVDATATRNIVSEARALVRFEGEKGWNLKSGNELDTNLVRGFIRQFPLTLRQDAKRLVTKLTVLERDQTIRLLHRALTDYVAELGRKPTALVPLTPSSGARVRTILREELSGFPEFHVASTIHDALDDRAAFEQILFVDDNIVSGNQCLEQLRYWFELNPKQRSTDSNYFQTALSPKEVEKLRAKPVAFAFALGDGGKLQQLTATATQLLAPVGLSLPQRMFYLGEQLSTYSGATGAQNISEELRQFLRLVGRQVIRLHIERDNPGATQGKIDAECEKKALGYGNAEGLLATSLNVPSSTYTALWCPGTYRLRPEGPEIPWLPLLIRDGHALNAVLF